MQKLFFLLSASALLTACNTDKPTGNQEQPVQKKTLTQEFPAKVNLRNLKQTAFVPTLEHSVSTDKNVIYAPALLYAWDQVRGLIKEPIHISLPDTSSLSLLNKSTSYKDALKSNEYQAEAHMEDDAIIATAFFNKTLPFKTPFQKIEGTHRFKGEKVKAFGMSYYDHERIEQFEILYYKSDDQFIIRLIPADNQHEIILAKGVKLSRRFADIIRETESLIEKGKKEKKNSPLRWKYEFTDDDSLSIPIIRFNIETHYEDLEGQKFSTKLKSHIIETAYQRTALILDESGAIVESEAVMAVDSTAIHPPTEKPKPKYLIFDSPYLMLIKRTESKNPYFVMKVQNSELMVKE
ncbi:MAG: hypothetical protein ACJ75J_07395 [Cytophagaceae bacterium]